LLRDSKWTRHLIRMRERLAKQGHHFYLYEESALGIEEGHHTLKQFKTANRRRTMLTLGTGGVDLIIIEAYNIILTPSWNPSEIAKQEIRCIGLGKSTASSRK